MVKFAFLLHTIYKCLCVAALNSSEWSWWNSGPILSCTGRCTCQRVSSWQRRQRNKVSWKFVTLRGLDNVCQFSLWENNSFPSQQKLENNIKWHPLYILYIFCTFIYRLISSNRLFSSLCAFLLIGWNFNHVKKWRPAMLPDNWSCCFFLFFLFSFYIFNNRHVNKNRHRKKQEEKWFFLKRERGKKTVLQHTATHLYWRLHWLTDKPIKYW